MWFEITVLVFIVVHFVVSLALTALCWGHSLRIVEVMTRLGAIEAVVKDLVDKFGRLRRRPRVASPPRSPADAAT